MGQRLGLNARGTGVSQNLQAEMQGLALGSALASDDAADECGVFGLRKAAATSGSAITDGARIESEQRRSFHVPGATRVAGALVAGGLMVGMALSGVPASAQASLEQRESARAVAKLLIHDERMREAGLLAPKKPEPARPSPWAVLASAVLASAVLATGIRQGKHLYEKKVSRDEANRVRLGIEYGLQSPFRGVKIQALSALGERPDLAKVPVKLLLDLRNDQDKSVVVLSKRLLAKHPMTPESVLKELAADDRFHVVRMDAMAALLNRGV